jgi:nucleoid-associated protein YgaU
MSYGHGRRGSTPSSGESDSAAKSGSAGTPGKRALTDTLTMERSGEPAPTANPTGTDGAAARAPSLSASAGLQLFAQRKAEPGGVRPDADQAIARASSSTGAPLPPTLRGKFEGGLGVDLSDVRVHTGGESAAAAQAVSARAFAVGSDVHFGRGEYEPDSQAGQRLIAHEVVHTVQQRGAAPVTQHKLEVSSPGDAAEVEADTLAESLVSDTPSAPARMSQPVARAQRTMIYRSPPTGPSGTGTQGGTHTVAAGESLSKIAQKWYGDANQWSHIYESNKSVIGPDPNFVGVGMVLFIPPSDVQGKLGTEVGKGMDIANTSGNLQYTPNPVPGVTYNTAEGYLDPTYWVAITGQNWTFKLKDGQSASAAIDSLFNSPTRLECLSTTGAIFARSVRETIGAEAFDKNFGAKGKNNQDLVIGPNAPEYQASRMNKLINRVTPASAADLLPGDWVYFWNCAQYHVKHPGGYWGGENAIYKGNGLFSGFGAADMTEEQLNRELHKQYNDGLDPADQMTFTQWQNAKNERGGKTGLDLSVTQRLDSKKVGDLMP